MVSAIYAWMYIVYMKCVEMRKKVSNQRKTGEKTERRKKLQWNHVALCVHRLLMLLNQIHHMCAIIIICIIITGVFDVVSIRVFVSFSFWLTDRQHKCDRLYHPLWQQQQQHRWHYQILGCDILPVCINTSKRTLCQQTHDRCAT